MARIGIDYYPGNGQVYSIVVDHIAIYPRDVNGFCAFCHGDPCNEEFEEGSLIDTYCKDTPDWISCPMCDGRAT